MRTVVTKETDGYPVVKGLDYPVPNPVATRLKAKPLFQESAECDQQIKAAAQCRATLAQAETVCKKKRYAMLVTKFNEEYQKELPNSEEYKEYLKLKKALPKNPSLEENQAVMVAWQEFDAWRKDLLRATNANDEFFKSDTYLQFKELEKNEKAKVQEKARIASEKRQALFKEHAVYFTPRSGEEIITDEEGEIIKAELDSLPENAVLSRKPDGELETVADFRDKEYWLYSVDTWTKSKITALGNKPPESAVFPKDLSAADKLEIGEQLEEERIEALAQVDRQAEFDQVLAALNREMVFFRQELEINGDTAEDALSQTQEELASRRTELETKYSIVN